ncbi:hypothetical protein MMC07_007525, partial [Pseudocyphellaria aurata]|nr:hypothetical protein [Pseudocyphellaria aurata]
MKERKVAGLLQVIDGLNKKGSTLQAAQRSLPAPTVNAPPAAVGPQPSVPTTTPQSTPTIEVAVALVD